MVEITAGSPWSSCFIVECAQPYNNQRTSGGTRVVLVSEAEVAAQPFLIVEGMGLGWQATGHGGRGAAALLGSATPRA